jgi:acylphosphatase
MKLEITITGKKVHDIGYRHFLLTHALMRGIDRLFTYNSYIQDKQAVILLVEGEDADVADMLDFVKTNFPKDAEGVEDIKSKVYEGKIMDIYQFMHLAQVEQLDKGIPAIIEMKGDVKEMKGDVKEMKGDVKEILVKQDETIQEIKKLRFDLKSYLDTRFEEVFSEIGKIKEKIGLS